MTTREKKLSIILSGVLGVILIGGAIIGLANTAGNSGESTHFSKKRLREMKQVLETQEFWTSRDNWLMANIPSYSSETAASAKLLERVARITKAHGVNIQSQEILKTNPELYEEDDSQYFFDRIELAVELSGDIRQIVESILEMQTPEYFTGIDRLTLESNKKEGLKCRLLITHWYNSNQNVSQR